MCDGEETSEENVRGLTGIIIQDIQENQIASKPPAKTIKVHYDYAQDRCLNASALNTKGVSESFSLPAVPYLPTSRNELHASVQRAKNREKSQNIRKKSKQQCGELLHKINKLLLENEALRAVAKRTLPQTNQTTGIVSNSVEMTGEILSLLRHKHGLKVTKTHAVWGLSFCILKPSFIGMEVAYASPQFCASTGYSSAKLFHDYFERLPTIAEDTHKCAQLRAAVNSRQDKQVEIAIIHAYLDVAVTIKIAVIHNPRIPGSSPFVIGKVMSECMLELSRAVWGSKSSQPHNDTATAATTTTALAISHTSARKKATKNAVENMAAGSASASDANHFPVYSTTPVRCTSHAITNPNAPASEPTLMSLSELSVSSTSILLLPASSGNREHLIRSHSASSFGSGSSDHWDTNSTHTSSSVQTYPLNSRVSEIYSSGLSQSVVPSRRQEKLGGLGAAGSGLFWTETTSSNSCDDDSLDSYIEHTYYPTGSRCGTRSSSGCFIHGFAAAAPAAASSLDNCDGMPAGTQYQLQRQGQYPQLAASYYQHEHSPSAHQIQQIHEAQHPQYHQQQYQQQYQQPHQQPHQQQYQQQHQQPHQQPHQQQQQRGESPLFAFLSTGEDGIAYQQPLISTCCDTDLQLTFDAMDVAAASNTHTNTTITSNLSYNYRNDNNANTRCFDGSNINTNSSSGTNTNIVTIFNTSDDAFTTLAAGAVTDQSQNYTAMFPLDDYFDAAEAEDLAYFESLFRD